MLTHVIFDLNKTLVYKNKIRPGTYRLLSLLRARRVSIVIWTSCMRHNAVKKVQPFIHMIDLLITRDEVYIRDPRPIKHYDTIKTETYLETIGINPDTTVFVDDSPRKLRFNYRAKSFKIRPFMGGRNDRDLYKISRRLLACFNN
jgi:hydroxymethylpyrimidine pyrophosphatase-like HAD family hydrolase